MSSKFSYDPKSMKKVFVISAALVIFMAAGNFMERDRKYEISGSKGTSASESAEAEEDISQEVQQEAVSTFADAYEDEAAAKPAADTIYVDITGEVNTPDLIELGAGERLQSAIDMAGGLTEDADRNAVNMAQRLVDGAQYIIPSKGNVLVINYPQSYTADKDGGNSQNEDDMTENEDGRVNINIASKEKLQELPGIGEVLSQRIIDYRNENGEFKSVEELREVAGIGDKKYEDMKNDVCV